MTDWLIAADAAKFDVNAAFSQRTVVDWSEVSTAHLHVGDRVFLYQVKPIQAITHVCKVLQTGVESTEMIDDREFWVDTAAFEERLERTWMRLSLLHAVPQHDQRMLTLDRLLGAGLRGAPQGRMRAPKGVSELVTAALDTFQTDTSELVRREQDLIADLGIERSAWRFRRGGRGGTRTLASFTYALSMPDAPTALAMLRAYITATDLDQSENWSVSAMPSWAGATDHQRFATISGGGTELFYVWFESHSGLVAEWGARFPSDLAPQPVDSERVRLSTAKNGDTGVHGNTLDELLAVLDDAEFLGALIATRNARATSRRADWHNPYLGALLGADNAPDTGGSEPLVEEDVEFERRYIERITRQRLHQAPLRGAALRRYGARCMYCGLDVEEVLEAAHIIPDSKGGAASTDNIRILCANHHSAFDKGLLKIDGDLLVPAPGAPEVLPRAKPASKVSDADRLLLFEWHANHLLSWVDEFASGTMTWNIPRGASTQDFHRAAITVALTRKFYTPGEEIALPSVVRSMQRVYTGSDDELRNVLKEVEREYRKFLSVPMKVEGPGTAAEGPDLAYDLMYGLLIHGDVERGLRLRRRGRYILHGSALQQKGWETVVRALRTIEQGRADGTLAIGEPLETLW